MGLLRAIASEIIGLFVDDGALALALLAWCALVAAAVAMLGSVVMAVAGPILAVGCAIILLGNVLRSGRRR